MYSEQQQVYWHSGLYLQPQHLQALDLHNEWHQAQHLRLAQPFNHGLIDVSINCMALSDYVVSVEQIRFIMPSGTLLSLPGNCRIEIRNFRDMWKQRDQPLTIWLALRRFDPQHSNATTLKKEHDCVGTRWVNTGEDRVMKDIYDHAPDAAVARICYNIRLLSDTEKDEAVDCECLPLARLRHENDRVILDPAFSPPAVTLFGSTNLEKLIDAIYFDLSARARKLEEYKRSEHLVNDSDRGDQIIQLLAMRSLNRVLPLLKNWSLARKIHPWQVYNLLCQLIGELSSFNDSCTFEGQWHDGEDSLQAYDHNRLLGCFDSARKTLVTLLNGLVLEDNTYITLENDLHGIFTGSFDQAKSQHAETILLLLRSPGMPMENRQLKNVGGMKLASRKIIEALIQHALPGIPMSLSRQPPRGVPNRADSHYFIVERDSELWEKATKNNAISFYWPDMPDDLQVQLIFVVPS
ncbi:type VI secretion system baseplate subunit TssK (plasmid) [Hafnia alvei]|uniref:type VI secretion system baseplate subunit TssK n=1 Tax=Hafnia alvei TaxID=569 RepID=UPI000B6EBD53|nr:type VI secretion system baseplate subunit TssK [Hafnia alvei]MBI0278596.1 type VI secretion system baseplate subunit TssK [Hafnia alvei]PNL03891.1 type VI secretion system baseplate subunit TssK [Hafnia alvei]